MKQAADSEKFRTFADAHRKTVYDKMLARVRRHRGDPNWTSTGMLSGGGLWFAAQSKRERRVDASTLRRVAERNEGPDGC